MKLKYISSADTRDGRGEGRSVGCTKCNDERTKSVHSRCRRSSVTISLVHWAQLEPHAEVGHTRVPRMLTLLEGWVHSGLKEEIE
jgi:hypothetical protein